VTNEEICDFKQLQGSLEKALSEQRAEIVVLQNIFMDKVLELEDMLCKLEQYSRHSTFDIREVPVS